MSAVRGHVEVLEETFEGLLRLQLTVAGRVAEVLARAREQAARRAQAASEQAARELATRLDAERAAARAFLAPVTRSDWWDQARPQDIAQAWETARAWQPFDPDAARAAQGISQEVRERYGMDITAPGGDPGAVRDALARRGILAEDPGAQRAQTAREQLETVAVMAEAARAERAEQAARAAAVEQDGVAGYDTPERRRELAGSL